MRYRPLGRTGLTVSEIGFGAWAIGGNRYGNSYGMTDDEVSLSAVARALDLGCTFFDTADVYGHGHSEELLGRALRGRREGVVIATKVGGDFYGAIPRMNFSPSHIAFAAEQSLRRLATDRIDLYQLHNPPAELVARRETFNPLERLREQGKILHYGISIHDPREGLLAMEVGSPATIQVVYNFLRREAAEELFPAARQRGVGIIAREPLHNGYLTGKYSLSSGFASGDIRAGWPAEYVRAVLRGVEELRGAAGPGVSLTQAALRFVLGAEAVSVVIPGAKAPAQVQENLGASA